jgi:hypothetical protein
VQGTLDLLILKILALEPLHGWAIGQRLRQISGDVLQVSDGSLYPALHKLEHEGWIKAEWKPSENWAASKRARKNAGMRGTFASSTICCRTCAMRLAPSGAVLRLPPQQP